MPTPPRNAGGVLVAAGAIIGSVVGFVFQQSTLGLLIGLAVGLIASLLVWQRDRAKDRNR